MSILNQLLCRFSISEYTYRSRYRPEDACSSLYHRSILMSGVLRSCKVHQERGHFPRYSTLACTRHHVEGTYPIHSNFHLVVHHMDVKRRASSVFLSQWDFRSRISRPMVVCLVLQCSLLDLHVLSAWVIAVPNGNNHNHPEMRGRDVSGSWSKIDPSDEQNAQCCLAFHE